MYLRDGFPGQRLHVLPGPLIKQALQRKPTSRMLVTDATTNARVKTETILLKRALSMSKSQNEG